MQSRRDDRAGLAPHTPVQHRGRAGQDDVHTAAESGLAGGGGALPYGERIQAAFGRHDVSGIKAHTDGAAQRANESMGSMGYATGSHVAFRGAPDLHTAAHEAAHIIQQQAGVQLKGGVGETGDRYEQHADAVAELVVQGKSAESLLNGFVGGNSGTHAVQRRSVQHNGRGPGAASPTARATTTPAPGNTGTNRTDADGTRRQLNQHLGRIRNGLVGERERHRCLDQLRYRSGVGSRMIGRISEGLGGSGRLPNQNIWQRVEDALTAADAALSEWHAGGGRDDAAMRRFQGHIRAADRHFRDNVAQMNLYQERVEEGNGQARETLTGVVAACAAAIAVAGATIGAAAGTAALAAGATTGSVTTAMGAATTGAVVANVSGAGILGGAVGTGLATGAMTAVFTGAERGGEIATGQRQAFDFGGLMRQAGTAAVTAFVSHILGGALTRGFSAVFGRVVVAQAVRDMPPTAREVIRARTTEFIVDFVRDTCETMLTTALEREVSARQGNPSQEGFLESVVQQMVRSGITGMLQRRILGRLDASRAPAPAAAPAAATTSGDDPPAANPSRRVDTRPGVPRPAVAAEQPPASTRGPGQPETPRNRARANTPVAAADQQHPASTLGPGAPETPRTRAPAMTPVAAADQHPASTLGPGAPETPRTRAPANAPVAAADQHAASTLGPGAPETPRTRAPAAEVATPSATPGSEGQNPRRPIGYTAANEPVYSPTEASASWSDLQGNRHFPSEPGAPVSRAAQVETMSSLRGTHLERAAAESTGYDTRRIDRAARMHADHDAARAQTRGAFVPETSALAEGASLSPGPAVREGGTPATDLTRLQVRVGTQEALSHEGGSFSQTRPDGHVLPPQARMGDTADQPTVVRVGTDDVSRLRPTASPPPETAPPEVVASVRRAAHERAVADERAHWDPAQGTFDAEAAGRTNRVRNAVQAEVNAVNDQYAQRHQANVAANGPVVEGGRGVTQYTTGANSCGAIAVQGTANGNQTFRSMAHPAAENGTPQFQRMMGEVGQAIDSGSTDVRVVASVDPRAMQRPRESDPSFVNAQYHTFPARAEVPAATAQLLAERYPDRRWSTHGNEVRGTAADGSHVSVRMQVAEAPPDVSSATSRTQSAPIDRAMTSTDDGVVTRHQQSGRRQAVAWEDVGM